MMNELVNILSWYGVMFACLPPIFLVIWWVDEWMNGQATIEFDKEAFDRAAPRYWMAAAEHDFFGVLTRQESATAYEYMINRGVEVPDVEPIAPTNERTKGRPIEWTENNWAWFKQCLDYDPVKEEEPQQVQEEEKEPNESGSITWEVQYVDDKAITHEK